MSARLASALARGAVLCALVSAGCRPSAPAGPRGGGRPDIVLVTIDTLRADRLGCYGHLQPTSPYLDSLAARGTLFERAWSTSTWTVPALASLMTGHYPPGHGVHHAVVEERRILEQTSLPSGLPVAAERLRAAGYRTFAAVSNAHLDRPFGWARGFDRFRAFPMSPAEDVVAAAREWRGELASDDRPFFLWLHFLDPHHPYTPHEPWFEAFATGATGEEFGALLGVDGRAGARLAATPAGRQRLLELMRAAYDAEIRHVDSALERLFGEVAVLDRALVVVTSDHGESLGEHGRVGHGMDLFEPSLRIPLIVAAPGAAGPRRVAEPVSLVDVLPTLLAAGGLEMPDGLPGRPLPGFDRASANTPRPLLAHLQRHASDPVQLALREGDWKLVVEAGDGPPRLFDLSSDPGERDDLAPLTPAHARHLAGELEGLLRALPPAPQVELVRGYDADRLGALTGLGYIR